MGLGKCGITVMRVPGYSPEAVAEHAMALALAVNRRLHKAYVKVRENDFSLNGLLGFNFYAGKRRALSEPERLEPPWCGSAGDSACVCWPMMFVRIRRLPAWRNIRSLPCCLAESDLVSLHCPLTDDTYHLICRDTIAQIKEGAILVNTSRGALVKTEDLIEGIRGAGNFSE